MADYRKVTEITADELLAKLTTEPQFQIDLFVQLGGDPNDHNYAWLSRLTRQLRDRGYPIKSSRHQGLWLDG
jgi:hypothetical protein